MYCNNCGYMIKQEDNFCPSCGNYTQNIKKQIIEYNSMHNEIQNQPNNNPNLSENVSNKNTKSIHFLNYKTSHEKLLVIINSVISAIAMYCFYKGLGKILIGFFVDMMALILTLLLKTDPLKYTKEAIAKSGNLTFIFIAICLILIIINIIMRNLMCKNNKYNNYIDTGFKVNKLKYVIITIFLGIFGIHRFIIKDKKGGMFRLGLLGTLLISTAIVVNESNKALLLHVILLGCTIGIAITDLIIALAKTSDNDNNIVV